MKNDNTNNDADAKAPKKKRVRDREATKERILNVAIQEFSEKTLDGARVEHISNLAQVNMRMIYHYFESKENLYIKVLERVYKDVRDAETKLNIEKLNPEMAFRILIRYSFDHFQNNPALVNLVMAENLLKARFLKQSQLIPDLTARLRAQVAETLERGQKAGVFRNDVDALQFWFTLFSLCWVPVSNRHTMSWTLQMDMEDPEWKEATKVHIEDVLMSFLLKR